MLNISSKFKGWYSVLIASFLLASCGAGLPSAYAATKTADRFIDLTFVKVYDGDTIDVTYDASPVPLNKVRIRLEGIDTPEMPPKAKCQKEADMAQAAKERMVELLASSQTIRLYGPKWDKYGGRILGVVKVDYKSKKADLRDVMIAEGFARSYDGSGQRKGWCD